MASRLGDRRSLSHGQGGALVSSFFNALQFCKLPDERVVLEVVDVPREHIHTYIRMTETYIYLCLSTVSKSVE